MSDIDFTLRSVDPGTKSDITKRVTVADSARVEHRQKIRAAVQAVITDGGSLSKLRLAGADLRAMDLRGVDFSGCDLFGTCFAGADLTGADFTGASCVDANFSGAKLDKATFADAEIQGDTRDKAADAIGGQP